MTTDITLYYGISDQLFYDEDKALDALKSKEPFFKTWEFVKTVNTEYDRKDGVLDLQICEFAFHETNMGSMLSSEEDQAKIKASKHHHTSLSVGDIVMIHAKKSEYYLCMDAGFERVTDLIEIKQSYVDIQERSILSK